MREGDKETKELIHKLGTFVLLYNIRMIYPSLYLHCISQIHVYLSIIKVYLLFISLFTKTLLSISVVKICFSKQHRVSIAFSIFSKYRLSSSITVLEK